MLRLLWRNKVIVLFIAALLILFPAASVRPAQALSKTLFVSIGIEKDQDGFVVSGAAIANQFTADNKTNIKMVSAKGDSVMEAINSITKNEGRKVSLAHCNLIILDASLENENLADILRPFLESFEISNNALLVWSNSDIEKLQETSTQNKTGATGGLVETIAAYNQEQSARPATLDRFFKDYFNKRESTMTQVDLNGEQIVNKGIKTFKFN